MVSSTCDQVFSIAFMYFYSIMSIFRFSFITIPLILSLPYPFQHVCWKFYKHHKWSIFLTRQQQWLSNRYPQSIFHASKWKFNLRYCFSITLKQQLSFLVAFHDSMVFCIDHKMTTHNYIVWDRCNTLIMLWINNSIESENC